MKVTLINHTPDPLTTLIFTKSTRLKLEASGFEDIASMPFEDKMAELEYMKGTIKSSWEFVDFIFLIEGVTRAFTHQLVRHRVGTSFAQQAQRVVDLSEFDSIMGPSFKGDESLRLAWEVSMVDIREWYKTFIRGGAKKQDARGIIPTNVSTNIIFKANLRTLHEMARIRLCVKAQGEFQDVFRAIRDEVVALYPWAEDMIQVECCLSGTCAFPTYPTNDCPVKPFVYNPVTAMSYGMDLDPMTAEYAEVMNVSGGFPLPLADLREIHARERAEAQPEAPGGQR